MNASPTSVRSALGGAAGVMACSCTASSMIAKSLVLAGVGATAAVMQPILVAIGAAFVVIGLRGVERRSAMVATGAFALMGVAALLVPQHMMASGDMGSSHLPWGRAALGGASLYLVAIAVLGYAFWRAFPSPRPVASGTAITGMAVATGCTCCLVTGSTAGLAITLGASASLQTTPTIFWVAVVVIAIGIFQLGGIRAVAWVGAGAVLVRAGLDWINAAFGHPKLGPIEPLFVLKWSLMIGGYAVIMYAFARAYQLAAERQPAGPALAPAPDANAI